MLTLTPYLVHIESEQTHCRIFLTLSGTETKSTLRSFMLSDEMDASPPESASIAPDFSV